MGHGGGKKEGLGALRLEDINITFRLIFLLSFSIILAISKGWMTLLLGFLALLLICILYDISMVESLKRIRVAEEFLLLMVLFLPFTYPGTPLLKVGPLSLTYEGVRTSMLVFARSFIILLGGAILLRSADPFTIVYGLYRLRVPKRLIEITLFALRYISVINNEYRRLKKAMRARAFKPGFNLHTYRSYAYLLGMLFLRSYDRADRVYKAMLARGFKGEIPLYRKESFSKVDLYFITSALSYIFLLSIFEWR